ncbi:MAG: exonuclease domain-containing protein, partial [Ruminococcus sp.]|nr:exonuclease domain-containing protein [Ruminococcus sp.]
MKTLSELFASFTADAQLDPALTAGEVTKVNIQNEYRLITLWVNFSSLIDRSELIAAEKLYSQALNASIVIKPHFGAALFSSDYFPQLYAAVKREMPSINGTLNNAEAQLSDDVLVITLQNGGKALLDAKHFDEILLRYIREEFDLNLKIRYTGTFEVSESGEEYRQVMQSAQKQQAREQQLKEADFFRADVEVTEQFRERQAEDAAVETEIREGKFATPQIAESSVRPLYGRSIRGAIVPIQSLGDNGNAVVWGDVIEIEKRVTKNGKNNIITIDITDYTGSVTVKVFDSIAASKPVEGLKAGATIVVTGKVQYDDFIKEVVISANAIGTAKKVKVVDNAEEKRVELHLHTNMSQMDALTPAGELVKRAYQWGHKAIAITDHGVAQAFPDAMHAADDIAGSGGEIKVLYGTEAYFMDDLVESVTGDTAESLDGTFICFDIETTGLSPLKDKITEIGAVKVQNGEIIDTFSTFADPEMPIPQKITQLTGITDDMVKDAPSQSEAVSAFLEFADGNVLVAHNAPFDTSFIRRACENMGREYTYTSIDTVAIARAILPDIKNVKLDTVANYLRLGKFNHHRATDDAEILAKIFISLCTRLKDDYSIVNSGDINTKIAGGDFKKLPTYHQIILAKNKTGL